MIPMPTRNSVADTVAVSASACIRTALSYQHESGAIGDVAKVRAGGTPSTGDPSNWDGSIVWITPKDLGRPRTIEVVDGERKITEHAFANLEDRLLPPGTVLFSSRAPIGYVGIAGVPLLTNQGFRNIVCSEHIDERYLFHILRADVAAIREFGRGNTFAEVSAKVMKHWRVPLPPLGVQKQVASYLDAHYLRLTLGDAPLAELPVELDQQARYVSMLENIAVAHALNERVRCDLEQLIPSLLVQAEVAARS